MAAGAQPVVYKLWEGFRDNPENVPSAVSSSVVAFLLISSNFLFANAACLGY